VVWFIGAIPKLSEAVQALLMRAASAKPHVVVASPALDNDLGLAQSVEDLAVEQLIAKAGV